MLKQTFFHIWRAEEESPKIITFCRPLDDLLWGGVPVRVITEFCGGSGTGKTQMCLQLCINVQFPKEMGGQGGKAFYIDTNQGFRPGRLKEIACCTQERVSKVIKRKITSGNETTFTASSILENISYIYCADYVQLMAIVINLRQILSEQSDLKLIVIDSFSFPLRGIEDVGLRTTVNLDILTYLHRIALDFNVAVVITNEVTTRFVGNQWVVCPSLGENHKHKINQRIILSKESAANHFVAFIDKSILSPRVGVPFQIKQSGIREVS